VLGRPDAGPFQRGSLSGENSLWMGRLKENRQPSTQRLKAKWHV